MAQLLVAKATRPPWRDGRATRLLPLITGRLHPHGIFAAADSVSGYNGNMRSRAKEIAVFLALFLLLSAALMSYLLLKEIIHSLVFVPWIDGIKRSEPWALILLAGAAVTLGSATVLGIVRAFNRPRKRPDVH
jgi:hypothetical protein